jgi:hypothetical protein
LERRPIHPQTPEGYALTVVNLPWGKRPFTVKRCPIDEPQDFALVEPRQAEGGKLELRQAHPPPGIELSVATAAER